MEIKVITNSISREELLNIAKERSSDLVKAVVDTEKRIMVVGGEIFMLMKKLY